MHMVLSPTRKKSEAKALEQATKEAKAAERAALAEEEKRIEAEQREAAKSETAKKKRGPADNIDPDLDI
jgi:translation initiation factor IF-3